MLINLTNDISINLFSKLHFNKFYSLKQKQFHFYKGNKYDKTAMKNYEEILVFLNPLRFRISDTF